jgi:hypothetical protein
MRASSVEELRAALLSQRKLTDEALAKLDDCVGAADDGDGAPSASPRSDVSSSSFFVDAEKLGVVAKEVLAHLDSWTSTWKRALRSLDSPASSPEPGERGECAEDAATRVPHKPRAMQGVGPAMGGLDLGELRRKISSAKSAPEDGGFGGGGARTVEVVPIGGKTMARDAPAGGDGKPPWMKELAARKARDAES